MSHHQTQNTRITPAKRCNDGQRAGAGRPINVNHHPNRGNNASPARKRRMQKKAQRDDYQQQQQQQQLNNPSGRSWSYDECRLILVLIIGIMIHWDELPTAALHHVSSLINRSYDRLHALWSVWRDERKVDVVDSSNRGGGASSHINHSHHIDAAVISTIIDFVKRRNSTGAGCTTTELIDRILTRHGIIIHKRTLLNVLKSLGYRYGKEKVIGRMNDEWCVSRIRSFLIDYNKALMKQKRRECVIVYTDESYVNTNHSRSFTWYDSNSPALLRRTL